MRSSVVPPAVVATQFQAAVDKTKRLLVRGPAGVNGIRSLSRSFGIAEDCGGGAPMSRDDFAAALQENGVQLASSDLDAVFATLDRRRTGAVDPADFVAALRVTMTAPRRAWVRRAWNALLAAGAVCDDDGNAAHGAAVSVEVLQERYRAKLHPDVLCGRRDADAVAREFAATFNRTTNPSGLVSRFEFVEYYSGVSASYVDDDGFVALVRGVWPMPQVDEAVTADAARAQPRRSFATCDTVARQRDVTTLRTREAELRRIVTQQQRAQVMTSALTVRQLALTLRRACRGEAGDFMSPNAFLAALRAHRLYFAEDEPLRSLDSNGDGTVDTLYYLELLLPQMPAPREQMLARLWRTAFVAKDACDRVDVYELQRKFSAENGQERSDFLSAWDVRDALDGRVCFDELVEWYAPQSAQVATDKDFEALLQRQWPVFGVAQPA